MIPSRLHPNSFGKKRPTKYLAYWTVFSQNTYNCGVIDLAKSNKFSGPFTANCGQKFWLLTSAFPAHEDP